MKILNVEQNSEEWIQARKGKITGSKLGGIVVKRGNNKKIGYYELMAERIAIQEPYEDPMERGHRLEEEAIELFQTKYSKNIEQIGLCISDANPDIALSPDGLIKIDGKYLQAIEVKCLSSANHLRAYFENEIPSDYYEQVIQYFIVDEDLQKLYFVFYDPRVTILPMFYIEVKRSEVEDDIKFLLEYQQNTLKEIDEQLSKLAF
jgi:putative phage-type endonuclease